jgi:hypothetical protein
MKLIITEKKIRNLGPCKDRLDNFLKHYPNFKGDFTSFLDLEQITPSDKIWVVIRLIPRVVLEEFAIDCASHAYAAADAYADAYAAAYAAAAAYDAVYADANAAAYAYAYANAAAYAADAAAYAAAAAADAVYADANAAAADANAAAADANAAAYAAAAAYAYAYAAAYDAVYADAKQKEHQRQIEALIWLVQDHKEEKI